MGWDDDLDAAVERYLAARDDHSFGAQPPSGDLSFEEQQRQYWDRVAGPAETSALSEALDALLQCLGRVLAHPVADMVARGVRRLFVLTRGKGRHLPWGAAPIRGETLADTLVVQHVETLAPLHRAPARGGPSVLYVGGASQTSALALGRAVLTPLSEEVFGPSSRDRLEELAAGARVLRVFAHGSPIIAQPDAGGIELDEDDLNPYNRFSIAETRMLNLRGARRVELWACESGRGISVMDEILPYDEPDGIDAAVLLAGAEVVVVSQWIQYALSTAMIAEAFNLELAARPQAEGEALATAIRHYRQGVDPEGVFADGVRAYIAASDGPVNVDAALRAGLERWRSALWSGLLQQDAPALPEGLHLSGHRLGPSGRSAVDRKENAAALVDQLLAPYRSPVAWAGWRVCLRSKEVAAPVEVGEG